VHIYIVLNPKFVVVVFLPFSFQIRIVHAVYVFEFALFICWPVYIDSTELNWSQT